MPGQPPTISPSSVGCVRLGATPGEIRAACDVTRDTILTVEGMPQEALLVELDGAATVAEIEDGRIWRIAVLDPGPLTSDSLGVGSPAGLLAELVDVRIFAGEGSYFVVTPDHCGLSFELEGIPFGPAEIGAETLADPSLDARISRVLIVGECRSPR
jgi:hypothetical protein